MESYPINHRAKWTSGEIKKLNNEIKNKTPINEIAINHKRTIGAIKYKLMRNMIADINIIRESKFNLIYPEPNIDQLSEISMIPKDDLIDGFKKLKFDYREDNDKNDNDDIAYNISRNVFIVCTLINIGVGIKILLECIQ